MKQIPPFSFSSLVSGAKLPFRGLGFLSTHRGLKRYAILPLLLNMFLYFLATCVFLYFLWHWEIGIVEWRFWGPVGGWLAAAVNWLGWLVKVVIAMAALAAAFFTFTGVGMVLASPFNDILSEKVEVVYFGSDNKLDMPFRFTIQAGLLSVYDSLFNLVKQLFCTLLALPLLFVPVIGFVPMFLVNAYFAGFGFLDSAMARNFLRPPHKSLISRKRFWEIIGFGVAMQVAFTIPFVGLFLLPVGVVSGTLMYCDEDWERLLAEAEMDAPPGFVPPASRVWDGTEPQA